MKLNEIVIIPGGLLEPGISISAFDKGKELGYASVSGYKLMLYSAKGEQHKKKVSLTDPDGKEVAFVVGIFFKFRTGETFFKIDRAWTEPQARKSRLMLGLLYAIHSKWHLSFMSDRDLTDQGLGVWEKLKSDWNVTIYDQTTGKRIPWNETTEKDLFVPYEQYERIRNNPEHPLNIKANQYYLVSESEQIQTNESVNRIPRVGSMILGYYNGYLDKNIA